MKREFLVVNESLIESWIIELYNFEVDRDEDCMQEKSIINLSTRYSPYNEQHVHIFGLMVQVGLMPGYLSEYACSKNYARIRVPVIFARAWIGAVAWCCIANTRGLLCLIRWITENCEKNYR